MYSSTTAALSHFIESPTTVVIAKTGGTQGTCGWEDLLWGTLTAALASATNDGATTSIAEGKSTKDELQAPIAVPIVVAGVRKDVEEDGKPSQIVTTVTQDAASFFTIAAAVVAGKEVEIKQLAVTLGASGGKLVETAAGGTAKPTDITIADAERTVSSTANLLTSSAGTLIFSEVVVSNLGYTYFFTNSYIIAKSSMEVNG